MDNPYQTPLAETLPPQPPSSQYGRWLSLAALLLIAMPLAAVVMEEGNRAEAPPATPMDAYKIDAIYWQIKKGAFAFALLGNVMLYVALRSSYRATWVLVAGLVLGGTYLIEGQFRILGVLTLLCLALMGVRRRVSA